MKIDIVQSNFFSGRIKENVCKIEKTLYSKEEKDTLLTVFPANSISGAPLMDLLEYPSTHKELNVALQECIVLSGDYHAFIAGMPLLVQDKGLCNTLVFIQNSAIRAVVTKKNLNADEQSYFVRGDGFQMVQYHGEKLAIGFYEDLKDVSKFIDEKPDLIICCAGSVFDYTKLYKTYYRLQKTVEELNIPLVYVNRVGGEGSLLFSGGSMAFNAMGSMLCQLPYFEECRRSVDMQVIDPGFSPKKPEQIQLIHDALIMGIRDYFSKSGIQKVVLGLSGGVDSALVLALVVEALGKEQVTGVLLPSEFSTSHSVTDAVLLAENWGVSYEVISIKEAYEVMNRLLKPVFGGKPFDIAEENIQARIRGLLLMAISNKWGAAVLNTTNKSEMAMGYGTLYGDMCGALSVIGDLYKTKVYEMCEWINREKEMIPRNILTKEPSAELRPNQKDTDSLPDYSLLDSILHLYIEEECDAEEIIKEGFDAEITYEVIRKVRATEYKRWQAAPVLKVSPNAFGVDRKIPLS